MTIRVNGGQHLLKITISVTDFEELQKFQRGIINLLSKVEIDDCNPEAKEEIKSLYKLLLLLNESTAKER
ncbi:hypothetical protein [Chryseosolibacter indicus]|uniref:Uncharacterized protein n=1 Tax=Chryseosolibacter indicus TaxID=2782351 RepID=A0ABS5VVK9_9BACT|nr:hypothetical protein [Chryseosolibacter indicus]MBT1704909.1 hypothetical protein [Chryseosolibacter indicus]